MTARTVQFELPIPNHWLRVISDVALPEFVKEKGLEYRHQFYIYSSNKAECNYGEEVAGFVLSPLADFGCGVCVSTNSYNKGESFSSESFHLAKELTAKHLGYSYMVATARLNNFPETVGAAKYGWKLIEDFRNTYSGHDLVFMTKKL